MMTTSAYGRTAARKYIDAYEKQDGTRRTVGCNLTFAQNMLSRYIHAARLEAIALPLLPETGALADWLTFAHAILDSTPSPDTCVPAA